MFRNTQAWRSWWLAPKPPITPGEALIHQGVGSLDVRLGGGVEVVGADLEPGPAGVGVGAADVDIDDVVVGAARQDHVEDLGQEQRVDDVTLDLDQLSRHRRLRAPGDGRDDPR